MSLQQQTPVVPPVATDGTLSNFSSVVQKNLAALHQAAHIHKLVTTAPAPNDGNIGDIYIVSNANETYLTIKTSSGWESQATDFTDVKNFGAVGNDKTNDLNAFQNAAATNHWVYVPDATYLLGNDLVLTPPELGFWGVPNGSKLDGSIALTLSSNTTIRDITLTTGQFAISAANTNNAVLDNCTVLTTGKFTAVDFEGAGISNLTIKDGSYEGQASAILLNNNSGGTNFRVVNSRVIGDTSDALGINEPGVIFKDFIIMGNFLACHGTVGVPAGGNGFSNAAAKNGAIIGNIIEDASLDGLHFEDNQTGNTVVGNVINSRHMGITVYASQNGIQYSGPLTVGFNQVLQDPTYAQQAVGIFYQSGPTGTIAGSPTLGNYVYNFNEGIFLGAIGPAQISALQIVDGNTVDSCLIAFSADGSAGNGECRQFGTNYAINCPTLFATEGHYSFGKIVSATKPTTFFQGPGGGYGGFMPSSADGICYPPDTYTTNGSGSPETIWTLFPASANQRFFGRIRVKTRFTGTTAWCYTSADLLWNGSTLTVSNQIDREGTVLSSPSFAVSGGNLVFLLTSSSAAALNANYVEFDGEYWDA